MIYTYQVCNTSCPIISIKVLEHWIYNLNTSRAIDMGVYPPKPLLLFAPLSHRSCTLAGRSMATVTRARRATAAFCDSSWR